MGTLMTNHPILSFGDLNFDAVVCLNGDIPPRAIFELLADIPLIAADGAAAGLAAIDVIPEFTVGDLDSLDADTIKAIDGLTEFIVEPDQDSNDFEKCLRFAQTQLWSRILVTGMHGGNLEHTLNNWSVLMRFGRTMPLCAYERGRYAIPVYTSFRFTAKPDELISLIPQPSSRLTTSGLLWELAEESLALGDREGARNRTLVEDISITVHDGSLLFFCDERLPSSPLFE